MTKIFLNFVFLSSFIIALPITLTCENQFTTSALKVNDNPIKGEASVDKGDVHLTIDLIDREHFYSTANGEKVELSYVGASHDGKVYYFLEKTLNSNFNLYALFLNNNMLTISKSYNMLGIANANFQTVYQCR